MVAPKINWEINIGTIIHVFLLLGGLAVGYGGITAQYQEHFKVIEDVQKQTTRIEHYLSSKDQEYWKETGQQ